jgi:hypothetical protein
VEIETRLGELRVFRHAEWAARFPDLVQGITGRAVEFDFGTAERYPADGDGGTSDGWALLQSSSGICRVARCRQVHGADVVDYGGQHSSGVAVLGHGDAIVTDRPGVLLAVTVADCVPGGCWGWRTPGGVAPRRASLRRPLKRCAAWVQTRRRSSSIWGRPYVGVVTK